MDKVGLPRGLVRYDTERRLEEKANGKPLSPYRLIRPRSIAYTVIIALVGCIMLYALVNRSLLDISVLHDRNPLFVQLSNGDIRNGYDLKILNKTHENHVYALSVSGLPESQITMVGAGEVEQGEIAVAADSVGQYKIFVQSTVDPQDPIDIEFMLQDTGSGRTATYQSMFITRKPYGS
jgi:polyferredoxin